jgi:hypothetical protein
VTPHEVLVDSNSIFASQPCSLPIVVADVAGKNGMVHDVQKLARAVFA